MKTFKEYINEAKGDWDKLKYDREYLFRYRNRFVIDTNHALDRRMTRATDLSDDDMIWFLKNIMDYVIDKKNYNTKDGHFLFFSKKLQRALIIAYRHDRKNLTRKKRDFVLVTVFPEKDEYANSKTKKVVLESHEDDVYISKECTEYLAKIATSSLQESEDDNTGIHTLRLKDVYDNEIMLEAYCIQGKVYHILNYEVIEID